MLWVLLGQCDNVFLLWLLVCGGSWSLVGLGWWCLGLCGGWWLVGAGGNCNVDCSTVSVCRV